MSDNIEIDKKEKSNLNEVESLLSQYLPKTIGKDDISGSTAKSTLTRKTEFENRMLLIKSLKLPSLIEENSIGKDPMLKVLQLCVSHLFEKKLDDSCSINESSLNLLTHWAEVYLSNLSTRLHKLMEIQRRRSPSFDDLKLLSSEGFFTNHGLQEEYNNSKTNFSNKINKLADLAEDLFTCSYNENFEADENSEESVFFHDQNYWIDEVITRKNKKSYIPSWMPPLPPDHTYKSTPKYSTRVKDPRILRERLVLEGRLGEKALEHIVVKEHELCSPMSEGSISSNSSDSEIEIQVETETKVESEMKAENVINDGSETKVESLDIDKIKNNDGIQTGSQKEDDEKSLQNDPAIPVDLLTRVEDETNNTTVTEKQVPNSKFDIVEFAKNRMRLLEERRKKEEERILSRTNSDEARFGRNFGLYSNVVKFPDGFNNELTDYYKRKIHDVIHGLRKQEKRHIVWLAEQDEKRLKLEEDKIKYQDANEIHIGGFSNIVDDASNGVDEDIDFEMDFGDAEDFLKSEPKSNNNVVHFENSVKESILQNKDAHEKEIVAPAAVMETEKDTEHDLASVEVGKPALSSANINESVISTEAFEPAASIEVIETVEEIELAASDQTAKVEPAQKITAKQMEDVISDLDEEDVDLNLFEDL